MVFFLAQQKISSLSRELKEQNIRETVFIGSKKYVVDRGVVYIDGKTLSGVASWEPLRLARASVFAERSPFFALPGTDIQKLREAIHSLELTQKNLSSAQKTPEEGRALEALYPIAFLEALANAEDARQQFIAYPDLERERAYTQATSDVFEAKLSDIENFTREFTALNKPFPIRLANFGGTMTVDSMEAALALFRKDITLRRAAFERYVVCQQNIFMSCEKIPTTSVPLISSGGALAVSSQVQDILKLWGEVYQKNIQDTRVVTISESRCLSSLKPPYTFAFQEIKNRKATFTSTVYVGNLFFIPTNIPNAPFLNYEKNTLNMEYTPLNTFKYYVCSEVGEDMGRVFAVRSIADFASSHPTVAPEARAQLLKNPYSISETLSLLYLRAALNSVAEDSQEMKTLKDVYLMIRFNTGGLDSLLGDITYVSLVDLALREQNIPIDITAKTLFLTHSAFPSFFRIGAVNNAALDTLRSENSDDRKKMLQEMKDYESIVRLIPREKIVHDLRQFLILEERL